MESRVGKSKSTKDIRIGLSAVVDAGEGEGILPSVPRADSTAERRHPRPLADEKGLALVLTILLLTLLASFGLWLITESQTEVRITQSNERREETLRLAESACWLGIHALEALALTLPQSTGFTNVTPGRNGSLAYLGANQTIQNMTAATFRLSPDIFSSRYFYNQVPPAGWMVNWQGSTAYYTAFFLCRGHGIAQLPASKGASVSTLFTFLGRPVR